MSENKIISNRCMAKLFKSSLANKCQMKIIYIPFKQSHEMFHSLKEITWRNVQDKNHCTLKMLHGSATCTAISFLMFALPASCGRP